MNVFVLCILLLYSTIVHSAEVEITVTTDFMGMEIDPEVLQIGGIDPREEHISSGKFELFIRHPGFYEYKSSINISDEEFIQREILLKAKPREIELKLRQDVVNNQDLAIEIGVKNESTYQKFFHPAKMVLKPGEYILSIAAPHYKKFEKTIVVSPGDTSLILNETLIIKDTKLVFDFAFENRLGKKITKEYLSGIPTIFFESLTQATIYKDKTGKLATKKAVYTFDLNKSKSVHLKPGHYKIVVSLDGFKPIKEDVVIHVGQTQKFFYRLIALPRVFLSYAFVSATGCHGKSFKSVINKRNGYQYNWGDKLEPGEEITFIVEFEEYEKFERTVKVLPRSGNFCLSVYLPSLTRKKTIDSYLKIKESPQFDISGFTYLETKEYHVSNLSYQMREYRHDATGITFVLIPASTFLFTTEEFLALFSFVTECLASHKTEHQFIRDHLSASLKQEISLYTSPNRKGNVPTSFQKLLVDEFNSLLAKKFYRKELLQEVTLSKDMERSLKNYSQKESRIAFNRTFLDTFYLDSNNPKIQKPFLMAKYETTQKIWKKVMGKNPSHFVADDRPVEKIKLKDCLAFCEKTGLSLPTPKQWEYACRAGSATKYFWGNHFGLSDAYCWNFLNSNEQTHPVGQKSPNAFGLHDMAGNVWEICGSSEDNFFVGGGYWRALEESYQSNFQKKFGKTYSYPVSDIGVRFCFNIQR